MVSAYEYSRNHVPTMKIGASRRMIRAQRLALPEGISQAYLSEAHCCEHGQDREHGGTLPLPAYPCKGLSSLSPTVTTEGAS